MNVTELGTDLVRLCTSGESDAATDKYYSDAIVSFEGQDSATDQRSDGIVAVRAKQEWWNNNHEIHAISAEGPYCGHRQDQFVVRIHIDVTPKGESRMQMAELGIYTVKADKIVQEEFLHLMG